MKFLWVILWCSTLPSFAQTGRAKAPVEKKSFTAETPIFVINGEPGTWKDFLHLSPSQVGSLKLLKDSDAIALYGSRGAFGVLVVHTADTVSALPPISTSMPMTQDSLWNISIHRVGTPHDSLHFYSIQLQYDSKPYPSGAGIVCRFRENGTRRDIPFSWQGGYWYADFSIHSDAPLPVDIIVLYQNKKNTLHATLNKVI